ncbi:pickpocket protein 19 [Drosophila ficusphila]|uniref:pickpocket protein 19 n=1 Tax=Drosophila ficusphila TaxID=30025 RepID=UPI0007E6C503|nr:pickpocket protein 19 [Drosophila ficusphila]
MVQGIQGEQRPGRRNFFWQTVSHLKDYCANCSLAGFAYIANSRLHITERVFWLACVIISSLGCYLLIADYQRSFPTRAVSIVHESLPPFTKWTFPTVAVCEYVYKNKMSTRMEEYIQSLGPDHESDYSYIVESAIAGILYPHSYNEGAYKSKCSIPKKCPTCAECPKKNYRLLATMYGGNCTEFFVECKLSGKPFDCCRYFLSMFTPYGRCFMLNSLQNNEPGSRHWLPNKLDPADQKAHMQLVTVSPIYVALMNAEDVPHTGLLPTGTLASKQGVTKVFYFNQMRMKNDPDVREVEPKVRSCLFPDENKPSSLYRVYSFNSCIIDCARERQFRLCNCTSFLMNPEADPRFPDCDLEGFYCLEGHSAMRPDQTLLVKNNKEGGCNCLPSCNDGDISAVYDDVYSFDRNGQFFNVSVSMPAPPTDQFRRQALRTRLDVVVSMGGMLGLFLGASILSGIEFVYYFTVRPLTNILQAR